MHTLSRPRTPRRNSLKGFSIAQSLQNRVLTVSRPPARCPRSWGRLHPHRRPGRRTPRSEPAPADDFAKFPYIRFGLEAQAVFIKWSTDLHRAQIEREDNPIIRQHLTKYDKVFPALALILHLVDCVHHGVTGPVTEDAALRAAAWCEYLEGHARRCYGLLADAGLRAAQALSERIKRGMLADGFTMRDVRRSQWQHLTADEAIRAALDWLVDEGWVRPEASAEKPAGGRPTVRYRINPALPRKEGDR